MSREEESDRLVEGLIELADKYHDDTEPDAAELTDLAIVDGSAAAQGAADILINHDVKLPDDLYELFKKFGGPLDYLEEEFLELQEIYLRKKRDEEIIMYGNDKEYSYHFKTEVQEKEVAPLLDGLDWYLGPSRYPDHVTQVYIEDLHNIDEMLKAFRSAGLDPVPEHVADEPWVYRPEKESFDEYMARIGLAE
ncbi:MAG: hypothetical protein Q4E01_05370 [Actinomycetaceae bacterium]|nr:hypothetical protein [Actinomycetaceae bacterium]